MLIHRAAWDMSVSLQEANGKIDEPREVRRELSIVAPIRGTHCVESSIQQLGREGQALALDKDEAICCRS